MELPPQPSCPLIYGVDIPFSLVSGRCNIKVSAASSDPETVAENVKITIMRNVEESFQVGIRAVL